MVPSARLLLALCLAWSAASRGAEGPLGPRVTLEADGVTLGEAVDRIGRQLNVHLFGFRHDEVRLARKADFHLHAATPREALAAIETVTGLRCTRFRRDAWMFQPSEDGGPVARLDLDSWLVSVNSVAFNRTGRLVPGVDVVTPTHAALTLDGDVQVPSDPELLRLVDVGAAACAYDAGETPAVTCEASLTEAGAHIGLTLPEPDAAAHRLRRADFDLTLADVTETLLTLDHWSGGDEKRTLSGDGYSVTAQRRAGGAATVRLTLPAEKPTRFDEYYRAHLLDGQFLSAHGDPLYTAVTPVPSEAVGKGGNIVLRFDYACAERDVTLDQLVLRLDRRGTARHTLAVRFADLPLPTRSLLEP